MREDEREKERESDDDFLSNTVTNLYDSHIIYSNDVLPCCHGKLTHLWTMAESVWLLRCHQQSNTHISKRIINLNFASSFFFQVSPILLRPMTLCLSRCQATLIQFNYRPNALSLSLSPSSLSYSICPRLLPNSFCNNQLTQCLLPATAQTSTNKSLVSIIDLSIDLLTLTWALSLTRFILKIKFKNVLHLCRFQLSGVKDEYIDRSKFRDKFVQYNAVVVLFVWW